MLEIVIAVGALVATPLICWRVGTWSDQMHAAGIPRPVHVVVGCGIALSLLLASFVHLDPTEPSYIAVIGLPAIVAGAALMGWKGICYIIRHG
jgi:hypothetical protein